MDRVIVGLLAFVMWNVFQDLASTSIINSPVNTEVMVGYSTYFNCSTSDSSREIHWYHYAVGSGTKDHQYVYMHGRMHPPFDKRFRIEKGSSRGSFDLVLSDVEFRDAGLYVCQDGGGTGQWISAQLVILDAHPSCETNIKSEGFIGPNSCGLEIDKIQLSCGVNYHGNIPPALQWTRDEHKTRASSSEPLCYVSDTRVTCNVTLEADIDMDGSSFVCQTTRAAQEQYQCTTDKAKVLYAIGEKLHVEKTIGDDVTCSAKTNSPSCSYNWIWFDGVTETIKSNDRSLKITEQGWYRCEAKCNIKENPCAIVPMLAKGSAAPVPATVNDPTIVVIIAVVATFVLCLIIAAIPGYFMWRKLTGETRELRSSVEELRDKDSQWKEEKRDIQTQLKQVEELTATLLEAQTLEQNQTDGNEIKKGLVKLDTMIMMLLRDTPELPVYRQESLHLKYDSNRFNGSISNGKKKKEKETPSMESDDESNSLFICDNYIDIGGADRTTNDHLCETQNINLKAHDSLVSKSKGFGRIGQ